MWVARDKNNELFLSITKPIRNLHDNVWKVSDTSDCTDWMLLDETLFPELKWEDEPIEVRLTTDENNQAIYNLGYNNAMQDISNVFNEDEIEQLSEKHVKCFDYTAKPLPNHRALAKASFKIGFHEAINKINKICG